MILVDYLSADVLVAAWMETETGFYLLDIDITKYLQSSPPDWDLASARQVNVAVGQVTRKAKVGNLSGQSLVQT